MTQFRKGARLGLDYGQVRVGVARSDSDGIMALPVESVKRTEKNNDGIADILKYIEIYNIFEVIVGNPIHLNGSKGASAKQAKKYAIRIAQANPNVSVRLIDERLTTVSAHASLLEAGRSRNTHKNIVDQVAATFILENALEFEKKNGVPAGIEVYP